MGERDCSRLGTAAHPSLCSGPHFVRPDLLCKSVEPGLFHLRGFESPVGHRELNNDALRRELAVNFGGERGIRTLEGLLTLTPLAGVRLRPLGHLSGGRNHNDPESGWQRTATGAYQAGKVSRGRALGSSEVDRSVPWLFLMRSKISSR
jgi:hypothetical protein